MAEEQQPKKGLGAKISNFFSKFEHKVGPNDNLAAPPSNEPLNGSKTGLTTAQNVDQAPPAGSSAPAGQAQSSASAAAATAAPQTQSTGTGTAFDPSVVKVVYVLGGPGAGKGTQCARLVKDFDFVHLSAGDLLRAEQNRQGSEYGAMIKEYIREGKIVPMEVTIKLLENAMRDAQKERQADRFLIDGFPRKMDQAVKFDETVCPATVVLFLTCPEKVLLQRLLERGKTSGRDDDNEESIKKRFHTFTDQSYPVIQEYEKQGKVLEVDSTTSVDDVYRQVRDGLAQRLNITPHS